MSFDLIVLVLLAAALHAGWNALIKISGDRVSVRFGYSFALLIAAIRNAKRQGWLSEKGVRTICRSFAGSSGGRGHLPVGARCAAMLKCFHTGNPGITVRRGTLRGLRAHDAR